MVMIRVPTLTDHHSWDHAREFIMAYRVHPPPLPVRDGSGSGAVPGGAGLAAGDLRGLNGIGRRLASLVSVAVAGTAAGLGGPLAIAQAAAGWDQDVLAVHGCRVSPRTGLRVAPSASTLGRLPEMIDPDGFEAALTACVAEAALDPAVPPRAAHRAEESAPGIEPEEEKTETTGRGELPGGERGRLVPARTRCIPGWTRPCFLIPGTCPPAAPPP